MATKTKATIAEMIEATHKSGVTMAELFLGLRLRTFMHSLKTELTNPAAAASGNLLNESETIALAEKLLCRALKAEFTRADVEAFLRG